MAVTAGLPRWNQNTGVSTLALRSQNQPTAPLRPKKGGSAIRAGGGYRFFTTSDLTTGSQLPPGGGSWSSMSDRNTKENFKRVDSSDVLNRLVAIPLETWNYKSQDTSIRHIGPMAQDFYAAFGVGEDDRHITTIDADGVALAAIQGLYEIVQEKNRVVADQARQISRLEARLAALESLVKRR